MRIEIISDGMGYDVRLSAAEGARIPVGHYQQQRDGRLRYIPEGEVE